MQVLFFPAVLQLLLQILSRYSLIHHINGSISFQHLKVKYLNFSQNISTLFPQINPQGPKPQT